MNHSQHGAGNAAMPKQNLAYDRAQSALGGPIAETLQVDGSIDALGEAVEFHLENVQMLLRRLHPVTGDIAQPAGEDAKACINWKVPLAQRIDNRRDQLAELTIDVQSAIRALQV